MESACNYRSDGPSSQTPRGVWRSQCGHPPAARTRDDRTGSISSPDWTPLRPIRAPRMEIPRSANCVGRAARRVCPHTKNLSRGRGRPAPNKSERLRGGGSTAQSGMGASRRTTHDPVRPDRLLRPVPRQVPGENASPQNSTRRDGVGLCSEDSHSGEALFVRRRYPTVDGCARTGDGRSGIPKKAEAAEPV